jgi:hypothetical protein
MGLPSKGWQEIQESHYQRIALSKIGPSWLIAIIRKQWLIARDIWDYRNSIVHNKDNGTDIQPVATAIRAEYAAGAPSRDMRKFHCLPLRDTLQQNFGYQTNWLHRVATHRERTHRKDPSNDHKLVWQPLLASSNHKDRILHRGGTSLSITKPTDPKGLTIIQYLLPPTRGYIHFPRQYTDQIYPFLPFCTDTKALCCPSGKCLAK